MYTGIYISPIQVRLFLISACNTYVYDRFILKAYYEVKNKDKNIQKTPNQRFQGACNYFPRIYPISQIMCFKVTYSF